MKLSKILEVDCLRTIYLLYISGGKLRFSEIAKTFASRSSLSSCLKDLEENDIIKRKVVAEEKPVKVYYFLTEKGRQVGLHLDKIRKLVFNDEQ